MTRHRSSISDEARERLYREAMAARRAGDVCPTCNLHHSALSACDPQAVASFDAWKVSGLRPPPAPSQMPTTPPSARRTDPETSKAAAATDKRLLRFVCLGFYADVWPEGTERDGLVDDDLASMAGIEDGHESYRRRGSELRALGWTEWWFEATTESGPGVVVAPDGSWSRAVRRSTSLGASARVATITPLGRTVLATYREEAR